VLFKQGKFAVIYRVGQKYVYSIWLIILYLLYTNFWPTFFIKGLLGKGWRMPWVNLGGFAIDI